MFNINGVGRPMCKINGGKYNNKVVHYSEHDDNDVDLSYCPFKQLTLTGDAKFEPFPNTTQERDILYICGPSGSGKSFYTKQYIRNYIKCFPDNEIYMFSKLTEDKSLDDIEQLQRIILDERLITEPFDVKDFENTLVIMDDIDCIKEKMIKKAIYQLKDEILETGRHTNTTLCITSHLAAKGHETKSILNEAHSVVLFPSSGMPIKYLLENYMGLEKKQVDVLKKMKTRWINICRGYPMTLITEKTIMFLENL